MANRLTDVQLVEYKEAFAQFDKSGSGIISTHELGNLMKSLGQNYTEAKLRDLTNEVHTKNDGKIDFTEFCVLMSKHVPEGDTDKELSDAFKLFDMDGDGFISPAELKAVMEKLGENLTDEELDDMIRDADLDGDGLINYEEFVYMSTKQM